MSNRRNAKFIQGPSLRASFNLYEELQDQIKNETGVECTVKVTPEIISIRTATYADYLLAKKAIYGRVSQPIEQA